MEAEVAEADGEVFLAEAPVADIDPEKLPASEDDAAVGTMVVDGSPTPPGPNDTLWLPMVVFT